MLGLDLHKIIVERDDKTSYLRISFAYPYIDSCIGFSQSAFDAWVKGEMTKDRILHELCHIITDPLYSKAVSVFRTKDEVEDERERLTDTITMIVRNLDK